MYRMYSRMPSSIADAKVACDQTRVREPYAFKHSLYATKCRVRVMVTVAS